MKILRNVYVAVRTAPKTIQKPIAVEIYTLKNKWIFKNLNYIINKTWGERGNKAIIMNYVFKKEPSLKEPLGGLCRSSFKEITNISRNKKNNASVMRAEYIFTHIAAHGTTPLFDQDSMNFNLYKGDKKIASGFRALATYTWWNLRNTFQNNRKVKAVAPGLAIAAVGITLIILGQCSR